MSEGMVDYIDDTFAGEVGHTPGPWRFGWRSGDDVNPGSVCSVGGRHHPNRPYAVAMCPRYRGPDSRDPWDADARLIAAAPDLLRAAKEVLRGLNARIDSARVKEEATPVFDGIAKLHDAIAKAEGDDR